VRELQRPHESNKLTVVLPLQNMICGCIEVQKTVWVAETLEVLHSNRPVAQCSVWVQLINISDFSQLFDCVSNIIPLRVKSATYKLMYTSNCKSASR
jgi:hypothetical protein